MIIVFSAPAVSTITKFQVNPLADFANIAFYLGNGTRYAHGYYGSL